MGSAIGVAVAALWLQVRTQISDLRKTVAQMGKRMDQQQAERLEREMQHNEQLASLTEKTNASNLKVAQALEKLTDKVNVHIQAENYEDRA